MYNYIITIDFQINKINKLFKINKNKVLYSDINLFKICTHYIF